MEQISPVETAQSSEPKARFDNIDALRALAILLVIAYHFTSRFEPTYYFAEKMPTNAYFGWLGVDLFFMVSAYCIFMTLQTSNSLARFWAKRLARIQPAYMVGVMLTFCVVSIFGLEGREVSFTDALANLIWLQTLPSVAMVDGAYWSLVVELKFYFWFGLIYFLGRGLNVSIYWAGFCAVAMALYHIPATSFLSNKLLIAPFAPQFLLGVIAYEWRSLPANRRYLLLLANMVLFLGSPRLEGAPFYATLVLGFGFCVLQMNQLRLPRALTFIGLVSYPLYLVHQNIGLVIIRELYSVIAAPWLRVGLASALVLGLAVVLHYAVETRWQRSLTAQIERVLGKILRPFSALRAPAG